MPSPEKSAVTTLSQLLVPFPFTVLYEPVKWQNIIL